MNLLLVEDDPRVVDFLSRGLRAEGFHVTCARTGDEGLELGRKHPFDLIILDLLLPGLHGQEVCRQLREMGTQTPILILTALDAVEDRVEGLRLGADDYLGKPFAFDELVARIQALIRRSGRIEEKPKVVVVGDLSFDRETLTVRRGERTIELTAKEIAILELLMSVPGKVFSRERILNAVWGYTSDPLTNIVDVYIGRLRKKLDEDGKPPLITTVRGFGFRLEAS